MMASEPEGINSSKVATPNSEAPLAAAGAPGESEPVEYEPPLVGLGRVSFRIKRGNLPALDSDYD